jgi:hypothetical protein
MKRRGESGFALLLVFLLAAVIAIGLYFEMPRVAFESQRAREQMAIDRGLQYQRAIQLFYRKFRTYPTTLDDLETTRNMRFLRRRYTDPMTGKPWRLVHVGPGGILTDSNIKQANQAQAGNNPNGTGSGNSPFGSSQTGNNANAQSSQNANSQQNTNGQPNANGQVDANGQPVNPGLNMAARRPSDRVIGGGPEQPPSDDPNQPAQNGQPNPAYPQTNPTYPQQPGQPSQDPSQTGQAPQQFPGQGQLPGQPGVPQFPGQPGQPNNPAQTGQPQDPSQPQQPQYPGQPLYPGQPPNPGQPQYPGQPAYPGQPQYPGQPPNQPGFPGQPVTPGSQLFGAQSGAGSPGGQQSNQAANLIQQLLTTPRQPPSSTPGTVTSGGVGIAGVGGSVDGKGIHVIKDHSKYKEWEFVYDIKNDKTVVGAQAAAAQQQLQANPTGAQPDPLATPASASPASPSPMPPASPAPSTSN